MAKQYTFADVKSHNNNQSAWIVINNSIYDVTAFLNEHPGGEEVLLEQAGRDGSDAFEDVGHSSDARELMVKYKIGDIVESERKPVKDKSKSWADMAAEEPSSSNSLVSWIVPVSLGILATVIYHFYVKST